MARRQAERELHHLQSAALEAAADSIAIIDRGGIIRWVNPAFTTMTGYPPEEAVGQTHQILASGKQDPAFYQDLWETILSGKVWRGEYLNRREDGSYYHEQQTITPVRNPRGEITHFIAIGQDITERKRAEERIRRQLRVVQALRTIDMAITGSLDLRVTLNILLDQVTAELPVDAADVLFFRTSSQTLDFAAERGFRTQALRYTRLRLGEGYAGQAAVDRRIVHVSDLRKQPGSFVRSPLLPEEGFVTYFAVPLVAKGQVKGLLELFHRTPFEPHPEWLDFLDALAMQAALAIDNATLYEDLQRAYIDLTLAYDSTLEGWSRALDMRDKETEGHTQRVTEMTLNLARAMGMSEAESVHVRRGALLHDIGKIGIPDSILHKPGPLTEEEWEIMRRHPIHAYELLDRIPFLRPALDIPYAHHEKWDGTGYPRGLKSEQIPLAARIFAVVDVWDALRSDRPYRAAWSDEQALTHIREQAGKHFDPKVVEMFFNLLKEGR